MSTDLQYPVLNLMSRITRSCRLSETY